MSREQVETILLVEDEPLVLKVTEAMLRRLGYQVLMAHDGREAITIYTDHQEQIALVLTDLTMPDMGGVALAKVLWEKNPRIKIVALTGYPIGHATIDFSAPGIVDWAQKPLTIENLAKIITQWLGA